MPAGRSVARWAAQPRVERPGAQLATVEQALLAGARANGFTGELWTLDRIALLTERLTRVRHHPAHVWRILRGLGWTVQPPKRRAAERDQAAIDRWVTERWPRIKQTVSLWACGPSGSLSEFDAGAAA